jgi:hypothetical protein
MTVSTMQIKHKIIFGLLLVLSLQSVEARMSTHAHNFSGSGEVSVHSDHMSDTVVSADMDADTETKGTHSHHIHFDALVQETANPVSHQASNKYTSKPPAKYVVSIATLLEPPKAI